MSDASLRHANRIEPFLVWPALGAASLGGVLFPLAAFTRLIPTDVVRVAAFGLAAIGGLLFLRLLFDREVHRALFDLNTEMTGGRSFAASRIDPFDPDWGVFGARWGAGSLALARIVLWIEIVFAAFIQDGPTALLAFSAFWITLMATFGHIAGQPRSEAVPDVAVAPK